MLIGIPGAGKSSFFRARFVDTHVRVNLDMLRTPNRERLLVDACLTGRTSFVVDKTNVTREDRARYVVPARARGFTVDGYFFESRVAACLERNAGREGTARVPDRAVHGMSGRLELPSRDEGFDALFFVRLLEGGGFEVEEWRDEVR